MSGDGGGDGLGVYVPVPSMPAGASLNSSPSGSTRGRQAWTSLREYGSSPSRGGGLAATLGTSAGDDGHGDGRASTRKPGVPVRDLRARWGGGGGGG